MATACAEPDSGGLYSIAQLRAIEASALGSLPAGTLMRRAGHAVALAAQRMLASAPTQTCIESRQQSRILVAAGPGNNGGDALEAASELASRGLEVCIVMPLIPAVWPPDAQHALERARRSNASFIPLSVAMAESRWDLAIDGLFGIGLARPLQGDFRTLAQYLNELDCAVLAVDIPSGLDADHGTVVGAKGIAVQADKTLTFIANKPGLYTGSGRDYSGKVELETLGVDRTIYGEPLAHLNQPSMFRSARKPRLHASHKGSFGDLSLLGGSAGMGGALLLAARMGAMAGAGRVYAGFIDTPPPFDPLHPELMCRSADSLALSNGAIGAGPGMGMSQQAHDLLAQAVASELPLVLDADALNLVATDPALQQKIQTRRNATILTPHPLEAARLLGASASQVQDDRLQAAKALADRFKAVVVLKGSGTVISASSGRLVINPTGNPSLATAGTGDVLAGLCGSLLAQQWPAWEAALGSVWLHGAAADRMLTEGLGPRGITAGELLPYVRLALNQLAAI